MSQVIGKIKGARFVPNEIQASVANLIRRGKRCDVTEKYVEIFFGGFKAVSWHDTAELYIKEVSKVIYTIEWINSMVHLIGKRSRVLERGTSPLKTTMTEKGLFWETFTEETNPESLDVMFFPWVEDGIPPHHGLMQQKMPVLMIGSEAAMKYCIQFWERDSKIPFRLVTVKSVFEWFHDVKCWQDFEAKTWVALPQGTALIVDGICLPGPSRRESQ